MRRGLTAAALAALLALGACNKDATEADKKEDKSSGPGVTVSADESKSLGLAVAPSQTPSWRPHRRRQRKARQRRRAPKTFPAAQTQQSRARSMKPLPARPQRTRRLWHWQAARPTPVSAATRPGTTAPSAAPSWPT